MLSIWVAILELKLFGMWWWKRIKKDFKVGMKVSLSGGDRLDLLEPILESIQVLKGISRKVEHLMRGFLWPSNRGGKVIWSKVDEG